MTLKRVTGILRSKEVGQAVREISGVEPGHPEYIGKYQQGLDRVFKGLSQDDLTEMKKAQEDWAKNQYPAEVQKK